MNFINLMNLINRENLFSLNFAYPELLIIIAHFFQFVKLK